MNGATHWQCTCGYWIPVGFSSHGHVATKEPTFAELHEMRRAHESGLTGVVSDAMETKVEVTRVFRDKKMPVR